MSVNNFITKEGYSEIEDFGIDLDAIFKISDRRVWLCRNAPNCQNMMCNTPQIQLISYMDESEAATWKCRRCKMVFKFEPGIDKPHVPHDQ